MATIRRIVTNWSGLPGLPGTTTFHFQTGAVTLGTVVTALDTFWSRVSTMSGTSSGGLAVGLTLTLDPVVQLIDDSTGATVGTESITGTHTWSGNGTAERLPFATQGLIEWRSGVYVAGREVRGRTFIGGLTEDHSTAGVPSSSLTTTLGEESNDLAGVGMQIYSPTHHVSHGIASTVAWNKFAVLRSRRD